MSNLNRKNKASRNPASNVSAAAIETLEMRQLMAASFGLSGGTLTITANQDYTYGFYATVSGGNFVVKVNATNTSNTPSSFNQQVYSAPMASIQRVTYNGDGTRPNKLIVDPAINKPFLFYGGIDNHFVGGSGNDTIYGGPFNDYLYGGPGNDLIDGGEGNDTIAGGSGNDTIKGGAGKDTVTYFDRTLPVYISPNGQNSGDIWSLVPEADRIANDCENFVGGSGNDIIIANTVTGSEARGGAGNDLLWGSGKNDRLFGEAGNDELQGFGGSDYLVGGAGSDKINAVDGVFGNDTVYAGNSPDTLGNAPAYGNDTITFDKKVIITGFSTKIVSDLVTYANTPVMK